MKPRPFKRITLEVTEEQKRFLESKKREGFQYSFFIRKLINERMSREERASND